MLKTFNVVNTVPVDEKQEIKVKVCENLYNFIHGFHKKYWFAENSTFDAEPSYTSDINLVYSMYSKAKVHIFIEAENSLEPPWIKEILDMPISYFGYEDIKVADEFAVIVTHPTELKSLFGELNAMGYKAGDVEVNSDDIPYRKFLGEEYKLCAVDNLEEKDLLAEVINELTTMQCYCKVTKEFKEEMYSYMISILRGLEVE